MTLEEFLDEWHRQANEYGASLTRDQRDIAEQAWLIATQQEREACARACEGMRGTVSIFATSKDCRTHNNAITGCVKAISARGET